MTSARRPAAHLAELGQLARRAVEHVLDAAVDVALLETGRDQRHQLGQHGLGVLAGDADREPDHAGSSTSAAQPSSLAALALDEAGEVEDLAGEDAGGDQRVRRALDLERAEQRAA